MSKRTELEKKLRVVTLQWFHSRHPEQGTRQNFWGQPELIRMIADALENNESEEEARYLAGG